MSGRSPYDWKDIKRRCQELVRGGEVEHQWIKIAAALGISDSTLTSGLNREYGIKSVADLMSDYLDPDETPTSQDAEAVAVFHDKKQVEHVDWREYAQEAINRQDLCERLDDTQRIAEVEIKSKEPIAIMFTGDWHLGDRATNHKQWVEDIQYLIDTPNLFMIDLGDDRQNMRNFKNLAAVLNQALSPAIQASMMREVIDTLTSNNKMIAKVGGNHDEEFDERLFGQSLQKYLCEKMECPRFSNRGLIKLKLGIQMYTMLVFHKSRFRSFLRGSHGAFREYQMSYPADIVAGGHDHTPAFEMMDSYTLAKEAGMPFGGETYLIKVGTYQDGDYGWKYFHNGGLSVNVTAVVFPDQHKVRVFPTPQDAVIYMNGMKK